MNKVSPQITQDVCLKGFSGMQHREWYRNQSIDVLLTWGEQSPEFEEEKRWTLQDRAERRQPCREELKKPVQGSS